MHLIKHNHKGELNMWTAQGNRISFLELLYKPRHNNQASKALLYKCSLQGVKVASVSYTAKEKTYNVASMS